MAPHLKRAMQGSKSLAPLSSSRPKRAPMTIAHLLTLRNNLDLNNTFDTAVFGTATVTFWCQCHLTEVCVDASFDPHIHASRSSQQTSGTTSLGISFHSFWAPSTKTSPKGEEIRWIDSKCLCSAEWAFQNHCSVNNHMPSSHHILHSRWRLASSHLCTRPGSWNIVIKFGLNVSLPRFQVILLESTELLTSYFWE